MHAKINDNNETNFFVSVAIKATGHDLSVAF